MASFDVMPDVQLFQPLELDDALRLADQYGKDGWILGGGQDTYGWLKDRAKHPQAMIDLNGVNALRGVRQVDDGIEIGAVTTLREIIRDEGITRDYSLLAQAAARVASPQIRNVGTLGGNLAQDARCWYYRRGLACYRAGGNICYADGPAAMNREHAIFDASRCVAVSPSDTATALVALEATMVVASVGGERSIAADDYFVGPYRADDRARAGRNSRRRSHSFEVGRQAFLFREGRRPRRLGLCARQHCRRDVDGWRYGCRQPHRVRRRRVHALPAQERRAGAARQAAVRRTCRFSGAARQQGRETA